jgi:hypothetical protein
MKKILFMSAFLALGMLAPKSAHATYTAQGWATIVVKGGGEFTVSCFGPTDVCYILSGNQIDINHWSGWIHGTVVSTLPAETEMTDDIPIDYISETTPPEE